MLAAFSWMLLNFLAGSDLEDDRSCSSIATATGGFLLRVDEPLSLLYDILAHAYYIMRAVVCARMTAGQTRWALLRGSLGIESPVYIMPLSTGLLSGRSHLRTYGVLPPAIILQYLPCSREPGAPLEEGTSMLPFHGYCRRLRPK
ncbi:hypothetical protein LX36DRAFT_171240 [Colletotrichum falcatum]|nr:hypothetical protein LX36DRAFT_171240 [Colletotrichum falcatum]